MQWEIVILVHSRRRSKKQQAVGPVGSRGSKLDKTTPTVKKFQGRRELQFLWDGWFKKAAYFPWWNAENPTHLGCLFCWLAVPSLCFWDVCLKLRQQFKQGSQKTVPTSMTGFRPCVSVPGFQFPIEFLQFAGFSWVADLVRLILQVLRLFTYLYRYKSVDLFWSILYVFDWLSY